MTKRERLLAELLEERFPRRKVEEEAIELVDLDTVRVARVYRRAKAIHGRIERMDPEAREVKLQRQAAMLAEADAKLWAPGARWAS